MVDAACRYWTPVSGMETIFVSILSLLSDPNPSDPANAEAAQLYTQNPEEFRARVRKAAECAAKAKPDHIELTASGKFVDAVPPPLDSPESDQEIETYDEDMNSGDDFDFDGDFSEVDIGSDSPSTPND